MADLSSSRGKPPAQLKRGRSTRWRWLIWVVLAVGLALALRSLPWGNVWRVLAGFQAWQAAALIVANAAVLVLFAARWSGILRALGRPAPFLRLLGFRLAGFGVSYFTPGPQFGGEPLQVALLSRRLGIPMSIAAASVFFDKLLELLANFTFLLIGLAAAYSVGVLKNGLPGGVWLLLPGVVVWPALHLRALGQGSRPFTWLVTRLHALWPGRLLEVAGRHAAEGEDMIGGLLRERPLALAGMLAISALVWVVSIAEFTLLLRFLGAPVSLLQSIAILSAARLAFLLPVPGGLGVLEAGLFLALQAAGFDPAIGLAAGLVIRLRDVSLGALGLWIGGWNFRQHAHEIKGETTYGTSDVQI